MKFSERLGYTVQKESLVKDDLTEDLKNTLWNVICEEVLDNISNSLEFVGVNQRERYSALAKFYRSLWKDFLKRTMDELEVEKGAIDEENAYDELRMWFFDAEWYSIYDFLEYLAGEFGSNFTGVCNEYLEREFSGYRFVNNKLLELTSDEELIEISNLISSENLEASVYTHLNSAIELLSDRYNPDYRNSIKESICAVESFSKIALDNRTITLGTALKEFEKRYHIPKALSKSFQTIYGYVSDQGGIRHGLKHEDIPIDMAEARLMLVYSSAFINYLKAKL